MGKPARSAPASNPARARLGIGCWQLAHLDHRLKETPLEITRKRHFVAHASGQHEHAVWWPNTIDLLNEQALGGELHQVRGVNTSRMWLLLNGMEMMPRTQ